MAISKVAARLGGIIGNIVIAALLDLYCPLPTYIVAVLLIGISHYNFSIIVFNTLRHMFLLNTFYYTYI